MWKHATELKSFPHFLAFVIKETIILTFTDIYAHTLPSKPHKK